MSSILDYYIDNFIFIIFNNIILEFDYIYIHKCKLQTSNIILNELYNYDLINNSNDTILIYKKNINIIILIAYFINCLFY